MSLKAQNTLLLLLRLSINPIPLNEITSCTYIKLNRTD